MNTTFLTNILKQNTKTSHRVRKKTEKRKQFTASGDYARGAIIEKQLSGFGLIEQYNPLSVHTQNTSEIMDIQM